MQKKSRRNYNKKSKSNHKRKRIRISLEIVLAIIGVVVACVALVLQFFDLKLPIRRKPSVDISQEQIRVELLEKLREDDNVYPLFTDVLSEQVNEEENRNYATQVFITNDYEESILID